jgi:hypothetical protein
MSSASAIGDRERTLIRAALRDLPAEVVLDYYTADVDSWYSRAERAMLETIAGAAPAVRLEVHAGRWDAGREAAVGIRRTPVIAVRGATDPGIRFYGLPDGYELETFLATITMVATGESALSAASRARLATLATPRHVEVIASPT